jgi:hypothetical protein
MTFFRVSGILMAVAALLFTAGTTTAGAESRRSAFTLMVWGPGSERVAAQLRCEPPGGSHPDPLAACAALTDANGDFAALRTQHYACTMELRPVKVLAFGSWRGEYVRWHQEYSNPCVMRAATGPMFDF